MSSTVSFPKLMEACEEAIRAGQAERVGEFFADVNLAKIPKTFRLPLANLCRRAYQLDLGIRILAPVVLSPTADDPPTPAEMAEYAVLLQRSGAITEALQLLESVPSDHAPQVALYKAFCHIARWDYAKALPEITTYLAADLEPYARKVGLVNLGACHLYLGDYDRSEALLTDAIRSWATEERRLRGNCFELRSQIHLVKKNLKAAEADLNEAAALLPTEQTVDQLFVLKGSAHLRALKEKSVEPIRIFKEEAERRRHWESVRDADFIRLRVRFEENLFHRLYFGTPFDGYRERLAAEFGRRPTESKYLHGNENAPRFDLRTGTWNASTRLKPGRSDLRLLQILLKDLYRPYRLSGLFAELFPGEHYNADTSRDRVHKVIARARANWARAGLPIAVKDTNGDYRIALDGDIAFLIGEEKFSNANDLLFEKLSASFEARDSFTAKQARTALALPLSSFKRFVNWALEKRLLEREGLGPRVIYRFRARRN